MPPETSAPSLGCPAAIEFLIHCHCRSGEPFARIGAPFYEILVWRWLRLGLIESCAAYGWVQSSVGKDCYALTDLGRKHLDAIESLPFPKKLGIIEQIHAVWGKRSCDIPPPKHLYLGFRERTALRVALGLHQEVCFARTRSGLVRYSKCPVTAEGFMYRGMLVVPVRRASHLAVV